MATPYLLGAPDRSRIKVFFYLEVLLYLRLRSLTFLLKNERILEPQVLVGLGLIYLQHYPK